MTAAPPDLHGWPTYLPTFSRASLWGSFGWMPESRCFCSSTSLASMADLPASTTQRQHYARRPVVIGHAIAYHLSLLIFWTSVCRILLACSASIRRSISISCASCRTSDSPSCSSRMTLHGCQAERSRL